MLDSLKNLGFTYATKSGISIGIDDLIIPEKKVEFVQARATRSSRSKGSIRKARSPTASARTRSSRSGRRSPKRSRRDVRRDGSARQVGQSFNPVYVMADSGARGSKQQIRSWPACAA
jgi:DNA-directed RNA polymerase subunit beta'